MALRLVCIPVRHRKLHGAGQRCCHSGARAAGNLFATHNNFPTAETIYKLSSATVSSGTATAASWAAWYAAPASTQLNGITFDTTNNRLLWANNSVPAGTSTIRASATTGATASATTALTLPGLKIDGLQINSAGNLLAIDATTGAGGAKLINLGTGTPGTVTNLTDGATCDTTVAIYKGDAWCSASGTKVIRLVGAGNL